MTSRNAHLPLPVQINTLLCRLTIGTQLKGNQLKIIWIATLTLANLMGHSLHSDLADCSPVRTGRSELVHHARNGVTFPQLSPSQPKKSNRLIPDRISSTSCPPWRPELKAFITNRGPHGPHQESSRYTNIGIGKHTDQERSKVF